MGSERISRDIEAVRNARRATGDDSSAAIGEGGAGSSSSNSVAAKSKAQRDFLKPRSFSVKLDANLNKSQVISKTPGSSEVGGLGGANRAGYYCDCLLYTSPSPRD